MRGILLAGGMGTRLNPTTQAINKHLIPIYDKPMIYYPLTTLMLAGVREICLVSTETGVSQFRELLGDGSQWGISLRFAIQSTPDGIADGIGIALSEYEKVEPVLTILGDNIFYGQGLGRHIADLSKGSKCMIWTQEVSNPESFGIVTQKMDGTIESIVEKPRDKRGNLAITGLYFFPSNINELVRKTAKSLRGEHEITEILNSYLALGAISSELLSRGVYWLDAGTVENLIEASQFVRLVQNRQGQLIGSPDEAALRMSFITRQVFQEQVITMNDSAYKERLLSITN
jgi:glucose-1-phosphate thymidylyltransferase